MDKIRKDMEIIMEFISMMLHDTGGVPPLLFIHPEDGKDKRIVSLNEIPKDTWPSIIELACSMEKGALLYLATETWIVEGENPDMTIPPSENPDRKEALVIITYENGLSTVSAMRKFDRRGKAIIFSDTDFLDNEYAPLGGRLSLRPDAESLH